MLIDAFNGHFCTLSELGASFVEPGEAGWGAVVFLIFFPPLYFSFFIINYTFFSFYFFY